MAVNNTESVELDVDVEVLRGTLAALRGRLRNLVHDMRTAAYTPGSLAGIIADIRALESIRPLSAGEAPKAAKKGTGSGTGTA